MNITLREEEHAFLLTQSSLPSNLLSVIRQAKLNDKSWSLELTEIHADALRDFCGERLQDIGFDENYQTTQAGRILENLIDKFYSE